MNTKPKYGLLEAKAKLESYCTYQERCAQEIVSKLSSWQIFGEQQDILIADLISHNFLNEERYAEAYVSGKFNIKKWGKQKIIAQLKAKRISAYSINKALKTINEDDYLKTLDLIADKKWALIKGTNKWDKIAKLKRYLYAKGYENEALNEVINKYSKS